MVPRGSKRLAAVVVTLTLVAGGCRDAEPASEPDQASASAPSGSSASDGSGEPRRPPDAEVIEAYVEAMAEQDVDAAMAYRCVEGRPPPDMRDSFESQLGRLLDEVGTLGVGRVRVSDRDPRVVGGLQGRDAVELTYSVTVDGQPMEEESVAIVADDGGERRICTQTTTGFGLMSEELGDHLVDLNQAGAVTDLADLLPMSPGPDYRRRGDEVLEPPSTGSWASLVEWVSRVWMKGDYGGVRVSVARFPSPGQAMVAARDSLRAKALSALAIFEVPGVPGASGVRFLGDEWLWVQPPSVGPHMDEVMLVFGDVNVNVSVSELPADSGHEIVVGLAREVARRAGGST